jgi:bacterioferritin-associated ferredoxin
MRAEDLQRTFVFLLYALSDPDPFRPCLEPSSVDDIAAFIEVRLATPGLRRLASHLSQCGACRELAAALVEDCLPGQRQRRRTIWAVLCAPFRHRSPKRSTSNSVRLTPRREA